MGLSPKPKFLATRHWGFSYIDMHHAEYH